MNFLTDEKILKVLRGYNEWWTSNKMSSDLTKPVKRLAYYEAKKIFEHPHIRREIILSGPRRVGKTTIMYQTIDDCLQKGIPPKNILYVSFDHPMLKLCDIGRILEVFQNNLNPDERELYFFFDEIQYAQDWDLWLKTLYDRNPSYRIMATGSASPILAEKAKESGVGRWTTIRIPTLSFYEYIDLMEIPKPELSKNVFPTALGTLEPAKLSQLMMRLEPLQRHFHRYLLVGGFPEVALSDDVDLAQKIIREDVVDKVLKRDMVSLFPIRNVAELEQIFLYLCMISGNIVIQDTIAKEVGISRQTVANYMDFLEQANLIYRSQPTEQTGKKVLKAKPKIYLADAAIRNAVLMIGEEILTDPVEMGMIIETAIYKHVHSSNYLDTTHVGYFRDPKTEKEIDIIVTYRTLSKILIEVKYRENTGLSTREAIVEWANDAKTAAALVITKNSSDYGNTDHPTNCPITKIPAFAFLYLLGHAEYTRYLESIRAN
ncbi:ATP-binding protein [Xylanibacillus composti]|uniref:ATPase n=1 Tax=Xylanibacillus composti TaxID=1572762 RepID=A0A8J4M330_9BACL|nr:ATP-binding protein [Xylanibacillus composti]MDT9725297.1 ATP-binding protein [Xylanibacillus composti]GIQ70500.1 ATPase [Xylanibacillus composti]